MSECTHDPSKRETRTIQQRLGAFAALCATTKRHAICGRNVKELLDENARMKAVVDAVGDWSQHTPGSILELAAAHRVIELYSKLKEST